MASITRTSDTFKVVSVGRERPNDCGPGVPVLKTLTMLERSGVVPNDPLQRDNDPPKREIGSSRQCGVKKTLVGDSTSGLHCTDGLKKDGLEPKKSRDFVRLEKSNQKAILFRNGHISSMVEASRSAAVAGSMAGQEAARKAIIDGIMLGLDPETSKQVRKYVLKLGIQMEGCDATRWRYVTEKLVSNETQLQVGGPAKKQIGDVTLRKMTPNEEIEAYRMVKDTFVRIPLPRKDLRRGKKDLLDAAESNWGNALEAAEEVDMADSRWQASTREVYRSSFIRFLLPVVLRCKADWRSWNLPALVWVKLSHALLLFECVARSKHIIFSRIWNFLSLMNPESHTSPQRETYIGQFKMLSDLVPPGDIERGIELDSLLSLNYKLAKPVQKGGFPVEVTAEEIENAAGRMGFSTVMRQRVLKLLGAQGAAHWTVCESDLKQVMGGDQKDLWSKVSRLDSQRARRGELEDMFGVPVFKDDKGIPVPKAFANKIKSRLDWRLVGECFSKVAPGVRLGEFFSVLMVGFYCLLRNKEFSTTDISAHRSPLGEPFLRACIKDSKGERYGAYNYLELACNCRSFRRAVLPERELMACSPCPAHAHDKAAWRRIQELSNDKRNGLLKELWEAAGWSWPTASQASQIMHFVRIGAAISAASAGIGTDTIASLGRWRNLETAAHYERAARRAASSVAIGRWPTKKSVLLDDPSKVLDKIVGKLAENDHDFSLGRHLFQTGQAVGEPKVGRDGAGRKDSLVVMAESAEQVPAGRRGM